MSMENAILVHAAALNKLAEAIGAAYGAGVPLSAQLVETNTTGTVADLIDDKAAELSAATDKRAAAARELTAKDAQQNAAEVKPDAELEQAVSKVEKGNGESGAATTGANSQTAGAGSSDDDGLDTPLDTPLDYAKDVRPVLLAAIKKAGKDKVQALISTFGVDKADKVDPAKHGELLAGAQKLAA